MDIRDARPWFWILLLAIFAVAAVGLVLAISAKNSSVDENAVVKQATAEIKEELDGLNGAIEAADEFQQESDRQAARDRARVEAAVEDAEAGMRKRLRGLTGKVEALEAETRQLDGQNTKRSEQIAALEASQERLGEEVARINRRLRTITADGG